MRPPRWTVYPALGVLAMFALTATPALREDPNAGAARAARERAEAEDRVIPVRRVGERAPDVAPAPIVPSQAARRRSTEAHERVVVLGIDGLDPVLLAGVIERYPERTTNLAWLVEQGGGIHPLGTSTPPQSPVAWSNFITGLDPGGHGIFDFLHRDPITRGPVPCTSRPTKSFFGLIEGQEPNRTGKPFWQLLAESGVPADIWRMPANFPPDPSLGVSFSGMLTPAVDSAYGECTVYTTDPFAPSQTRNEKHLAVVLRGGIVRTEVLGPFTSSGKRANAPLVFHVDEEAGAVAIEGGDQVHVVRVGQWSDFMRFTFDAEPRLPMVGTVSGIGRFYLRSITPHLELYLSPINVDPSAPHQPVSAPGDAAAAVADAVGLYYTQGMPEDVNALKNRLITDGEFLGQADIVYLESLVLLDHALDRHLANERGGLLFFYVSTVDLMSHMLWRHSDRDHPHHDPRLADTDTASWSGRAGSRFRDVIDDIYLKVDPVIARVRERMGESPYTLVVMSDHGFAPYARKFSLNTWLLEEGYLVLSEEGEAATGRRSIVRPDRAQAQRGAKSMVDWSKTRAYGLGFNGLYLNLAGREEGGIVRPEDADALLAEIQAKLETLRDPVGGARVVIRADRAPVAYRGTERLGESPDLLVGYASGYGNSDQASLGEIPKEVLSDNRGGTFNGSHLMAPEVVPGVLLASRPVRAGAPSLTDLTVELLARYGVAAGPGMLGSRVLE